MNPAVGLFRAIEEDTRLERNNKENILTLDKFKKTVDLDEANQYLIAVQEKRHLELIKDSISLIKAYNTDADKAVVDADNKKATIEAMCGNCANLIVQCLPLKDTNEINKQKITRKIRQYLMDGLKGKVQPVEDFYKEFFINGWMLVDTTMTNEYRYFEMFDRCIALNIDSIKSQPCKLLELLKGVMLYASEVPGIDKPIGAKELNFTVMTIVSTYPGAEYISGRNKAIITDNVLNRLKRGESVDYVLSYLNEVLKEQLSTTQKLKTKLKYFFTRDKARRQDLKLLKRYKVNVLKRYREIQKEADEILEIKY